MFNILALIVQHFCTHRMDTIGLRHLRENMAEIIKRIRRGEKICVAQNSKAVFILTPPERDEPWTKLESDSITYETFIESTLSRIRHNNPTGLQISYSDHEKNIFRIRRGSTQMVISVLAVEQIISPST